MTVAATLCVEVPLIHAGFRQRSLYTWKYIYNPRKENFLKHESNFESIAGTKLLVTQGTARYQMKGMDIMGLYICVPKWHFEPKLWARNT